MPIWSRPVEGHREQKDITAGIPDFLLYLRDRAKSQTMMAEVKTEWSYGNSEAELMLSGASYGLNGAVHWRGTGVSNMILKQASSSSSLFISVYCVNVDV